MEERKCVSMFRYTYAGIRIMKIEIQKWGRHRSRVAYIKSTATTISIEFAEKAERKQKGGYDYETEHKPHSAHNAGRKTGREENIHTRHRLIETGKQTRNGLKGD